VVIGGSSMLARGRQLTAGTYVLPSSKQMQR
jgi:hypothetical protein